MGRPRFEFGLEGLETFYSYSLARGRRRVFFSQNSTAVRQIYRSLWLFWEIVRFLQNHARRTTNFVYNNTEFSRVKELGYY